MGAIVATFSVQFSSDAQSCLTLCDPMKCSTPGSSVLCYILNSAQLLSHVRLFTTPWTAAHQASLSIINSRSLLTLMSTESVMPSNHPILCYPLLCLPSIFPSIRVFSNESALHIRWPKYWSSASASILLMNIQDWFPIGLTGLMSLQSRGLSRTFSNTTVQKHQFFGAQPSLWSRYSADVQLLSWK